MKATKIAVVVGLLGVVVLAAAIACAGPPSEADLERAVEFAADAGMTVCRSPCVGEVTSDVPINCRTFAENVMLARKILDEAGIVPRDEFCTSFYEYSVHVRDVESWDNGQTLSEAKVPIGHIDLSRRGIHLAHELLHFWDARHLVFNGDHVGWKENGYQAADFRFREECQKLAPPPPLAP